MLKMAGKESKRRMGDAEGVMSLFIKNTILRGVDTSPASLNGLKTKEKRQP